MGSRLWGKARCDDHVLRATTTGRNATAMSKILRRLHLLHEEGACHAPLVRAHCEVLQTIEYQNGVAFFTI